MKYAFVMLLVIGSLSVASTSSYAAERISDLSTKQIEKFNAPTQAAEKKKKKKTDLKKKFCCKSQSGHACYVFGKASCSGCMSFCSGDTVIDTNPKQKI
ncbi:hypothetical protein [Candidatus Endoriftia persephone]|jgi:hypothetical protein|uniref:Uncharacterized protein n=1 Tax=Candidatus Endoriftia persephonae TaxID=393765 RepID=A0A9J6ZUE7_9GAMM|nr:hypothetical protein [Candidatus Endoriftia persephone]USF86467.1 hypothetical protein L0Y14_09970 [Candidatus Endoriftia persephone]